GDLSGHDRGCGQRNAEPERDAEFQCDGHGSRAAFGWISLAEWRLDLADGVWGHGTGLYCSGLKQSAELADDLQHEFTGAAAAIHRSRFRNFSHEVLSDSVGTVSGG